MNYRKTVGAVIGTVAVAGLLLLGARSGLAQTAVQAVASVVTASASPSATPIASLVPTPDPVVILPSATPAPSDSGTPAVQSYAATVNQVAPDGKVMTVCPITGPTSAPCSPPVTGCNGTPVAGGGCQGASIGGCPGVISYPNGFQMLPFCSPPVPAPVVATTPTPAPTVAPSVVATPALSPTP